MVVFLFGVPLKPSTGFPQEMTYPFCVAPISGKQPWAIAQAIQRLRSSGVRGSIWPKRNRGVPFCQTSSRENGSVAQKKGIPKMAPKGTWKQRQPAVCHSQMAQRRTTWLSTEHWGHLKTKVYGHRFQPLSCQHALRHWTKQPLKILGVWFLCVFV